MNKVLKMALLASTIVTASQAIAKPGDGPRKSDPPRKWEPVQCFLGKVATQPFEGCPNEATLCSQLITRSLAGADQRDFHPAPHSNFPSHRAALQSCLVKFEREILAAE